MSAEGSSQVDFAEFYKRHFRHIYAYCLRRISPDRVDDAVAEVFLVAWRRIDDVPAGEAAMPWLYGVAYKVISTIWRGRTRQHRLHEKLAGAEITPMTGTEDFVVTAEEAAQALEALSRLKSTDQEILRLSVWEELPQADIAIVLGISVGAVKQRAHQARKHIAREYIRIEKRRINPLTAQEGGRR